MYGVSRDSVKSHEKFAHKYGLTMPLIADTEGTMCSDYDVLKEKNMYGKISIGIERTTVIVDSEGKVAKIFPKVKVEGHAEDVFAAVQALG